jgi:cell division protein FtsL
MAEAVYKRIAVGVAGQEQAREAGPREVSRQLVLAAVGIALVLIGSLFYVWYHQRIISLGYEISKAAQEEQDLLQANKKMRIELAALKSPGRIERMAQQELGFGKPQKEQLIIVR